MSKEDTKGNFVQFPLCVLAMQDGFQKVMDRAIGYSIWNFMESLSDDEHEDVDEKLKHARRTMGFGNGSVVDLKRDHTDVCSHWQTFESRHHETALVRIPRDYAFEMRNDDWPEKESRVYMAIASGIGDKAFYRLGGDHIAWRADGHVKEISSPSLSRDHIDYAASRLTARGLLACFTYKRRFRYWSYPNKCSREQMAQMVVERHLKNSGQLGESDAALADRITAKLKGKG